MVEGEVSTMARGAVVARRKVKIHCDVDWMKRTWVKGFVLGRHVFFSMPATDVPNWLFRHELEHVYQQMREGVIRFYLKYFAYSLRHGYKKNPFEIQAYKRQHDPLTTTEEQLLWKLREGSQK